MKALIKIVKNFITNYQISISAIKIKVQNKLQFFNKTSLNLSNEKANQKEKELRKM